jgi:hypothetical protein
VRLWRQRQRFGIKSALNAGQPDSEVVWQDGYPAEVAAPPDLRGSGVELKAALPEVKASRKNTLLVILAVLAPALLFDGFSLAEPLHYKLASDPSVEGKGKDGECVDYALALSSILAAHGIHGRLIFYRWHIRDTGRSGSHVFVLYELPDRSRWIVDNENPHPKAVPSAMDPQQLVFQLSNAPGAQVDIELQDGLNRLSFF